MCCMSMLHVVEKPTISATFVATTIRKRKTQNYFYGIMSQFDHQFCDEESRLGKSKTFFL